ncbi:MAG: thiol-disulfide isomerase/thioredoxin [Myxococcota bacterium]|jgi:thiol-disulfide isomerase/thioredoxin
MIDPMTNAAPKRLLVALTLFVSASLVAPGVSAKPQKGLAIGEPAPRFVLKTLNPKRSGIPVFSTKKHVGSAATDRKAAVLLSFGASHCGPCKKELPILHTLVQSFAADNVIAAVIVVDTEAEGIEAMRQFAVDDIGWLGPVVSDRFQIVQRRYDAEMLPLNVVIGGDGQVKWFHAGFDAKTPARVEAALRAAIAPVAPKPTP